MPLALLDAPWLAGRKIVMQEPRRLAARAAARRMAATLGEQVGETVGYRVRLDTKVGPRTRIEVVTDGLFLRLLQDDPSLDGVGCVIFDELHERGLETDLSFALVREAQTALREDLRVIAMSATLDPGPVSRAAGRRAGDRERGPHVSGRHALSRPRARRPHRGCGGVDGAPRARRAKAAARWSSCPASARSAGSRSACSDLGADVDVAPLYGDLSPADQDRAIAPSPAGRRKVVLATSIAETSLTIEGVRIVVDGGLMRDAALLAALGHDAAGDGAREPGLGRPAPRPRRPARTRRVLSPVDRGGAARPAALHAARDPRRRPRAAGARAGAVGRRRCRSLPWLTPPPAAALATARALLLDLGALDAVGRASRRTDGRWRGWASIRGWRISCSRAASWARARSRRCWRRS